EASLTGASKSYLPNIPDAYRLAICASRDTLTQAISLPGRIILDITESNLIGHDINNFTKKSPGSLRGFCMKCSRCGKAVFPTMNGYGRLTVPPAGTPNQAAAFGKATASMVMVPSSLPLSIQSIESKMTRLV